MTRLWSAIEAHHEPGSVCPRKEINRRAFAAIAKGKINYKDCAGAFQFIRADGDGSN